MVRELHKPDSGSPRRRGLAGVHGGRRQGGAGLTGWRWDLAIVALLASGCSDDGQQHYRDVNPIGPTSVEGGAGCAEQADHVIKVDSYATGDIRAGTESVLYDVKFRNTCGFQVWVTARVAVFDADGREFGRASYAPGIAPRGSAWLCRDSDADTTTYCSAGRVESGRGPYEVKWRWRTCSNAEFANDIGGDDCAPVWPTAGE